MERELDGWTTRLESRALIALARRMPRRVTPDALTALGFLATAAAGAAYALSPRARSLVLLVNLALAANWFGDSLDGTLARHRGWQRPRYGFYLDHLVDALGALVLLAGLGASGLMSGAVAAALLVAYDLFSIHVYLATCALGRFKLSYAGVGGTELRLLLAAANVTVYVWPSFTVAGRSVLTFDALGVAAALGLMATLLGAALSSLRALAREEPPFGTAPRAAA